MIRLGRLVLAASLGLSVAACATTPPPDLTPPPGKPLDAKTTLERNKTGGY